MKYLYIYQRMILILDAVRRKQAATFCSKMVFMNSETETFAFNL